MKTAQVYLSHNGECIRWIEENTSAGREVFLASHALQDAILCDLQTMAEATQRLSAELRVQHPEISWTQLVGFRNILVHDHLGINFALIWTIIQRDVPPLKQAVLAIQAERL